MSTAAGWVCAGLLAVLVLVVVGAVVSIQHEHDDCVENNTYALLEGDPTTTC